MNSINVKVHSLKNELSKILHYPEDDNNLDFLISTLTEYNPFYTTKEIKRWIEDLNKKQFFKVEQMPLTSLSNWSFDDKMLYGAILGFPSLVLDLGENTASAFNPFLINILEILKKDDKRTRFLTLSFEERHDFIINALGDNAVSLLDLEVYNPNFVEKENIAEFIKQWEFGAVRKTKEMEIDVNYKKLLDAVENKDDKKIKEALRKQTEILQSKIPLQPVKVAKSTHENKSKKNSMLDKPVLKNDKEADKYPKNALKTEKDGWERNGGWT